jgi:hypothetical protein
MSVDETLLCSFQVGRACCAIQSLSAGPLPQILKPAEKRRAGYGGTTGSGRPVTPPRKRGGKAGK